MMRDNGRGGRWLARLLLLALLAGLAAWGVRQPLGHPHPYHLAAGLAAYSGHWSHTVGERVPIHYRARRPATLTLERLGVRRETLPVTLALPPKVQDAPYDEQRGAGWRDPLWLETAGLAGGYYLARLEDGEERFFLPLILSPSQPVPVALVAATNTWAANNAYGGLSYYHDSRPLRDSWKRRLARLRSQLLRLPASARLGWDAVPLPKNRPNPVLSTEMAHSGARPDAPFFKQMIRAEWMLAAFLEREGVPFGVFSERDFALADPRLLAADLIIFHSHNEFWSQEMMGHLESYLARGGHVLFASGGNLFREVEFTPHGLRAIRHQTDPAPVRTLLGAAHSGQFQNSYAPYRVREPDHWVFAGLGLRQGDPFGAYSFNNPDLLAEATPGRTGAAGWEVDQPGAGSGPYTVLAASPNHGFLLIKAHPGGGWLINAASTTFSGALFADPVIEGVVRNVVARATGGEPARAR